MVCPRCITSVEHILKKNELQIKYIHLGEVELVNKPTDGQLQRLAEDLKQI
jgi:hypothetical protein